MSEIIKLYENIGIEKRLLCDGRDRDVLCGHVRPDGKSRMAFGCFGCEYKNDAYPPFTAEKQIEIIKFLIGKHASFNMFKNYEQKDLYMVYYECRYFPKQYLPFEEALAESINYLWQSLTSEEKLQVKGILE